MKPAPGTTLMSSPRLAPLAENAAGLLGYALLALWLVATLACATAWTAEPAAEPAGPARPAEGPLANR